MGRPTASEFDSLVTPLWKVKEGQAVDAYVAYKLAERWRNAPIQSFAGTGMMEQGKLREEQAVPFYENFYSVDVTRVGFITTDDGKCGCSPDGMFEDGTGIEVKCPEPQKHVAYLLAGECPKEYRHQVQGSMFVTGAKVWRFMSYCRDFPPFVITVERDPAAMRAIGDALADFYDKFDAGWETLLEANGGDEPVRKYDTTFEDGAEVRTLKKEFLNADYLEIL